MGIVQLKLSIQDKVQPKMKLQIVLCLISVGSLSLGAPQNYNYKPSSSNLYAGKSSSSPNSGPADLSAFYPYSGNGDLSAFYPYSASADLSAFYPYSGQASNSYSSQSSPTSNPLLHSSIKSFQLPAAATPVFRAAKETSSPLSVAALAYLEIAGGNDICALSTKAYLETILAGGSAAEATAAATKQYTDDYNRGLKAAPGSACEASEIAWRKAVAEGTDPLLDSTVAYMENWHGASVGNPCAVAGKDYVNAIIQGSSQAQAYLVAARSFAAAFQNQAAQGQELRDPACASATKAYVDALNP